MNTQSPTHNPEPFQRDCYAILSNGHPMPGKYLGLDCTGAVEVAAPNGRIYTFSPDHVLTVEEVEAQLRQDRIASVVAGYRFETIQQKPAVVRCQNPAHPRRSNYILTQRKSGTWSCSCPAYERDGHTCKHVAAYCIREGQ